MRLLLMGEQGLGHTEILAHQLLLSVAAEASTVLKPGHTPISKLRKPPVRAAKTWLQQTCCMSTPIRGKNYFNLKKSLCIQWGMVTVCQVGTRSDYRAGEALWCDVPCRFQGQSRACHLQLGGGGFPTERLSVSVVRAEAVQHHPSVLTRMATKCWHDTDREAFVSFPFLRRVMPATQMTYGVMWARSGSICT